MADNADAIGRPERKWVRMHRCAYDAGVFFVTICCCYGRKRFFGYVADGKMHHNELGGIADKTLLDMGRFHKGIHVTDRIVMPDHVHFIVNIERSTSQNLAMTVGEYKSMISKIWLDRCKERNIVAGHLWQSGFYEHIIRDSEDYEAIRTYIYNNPKNG